MRTSNPKLKLLLLARIFFEETDENLGLTMPQILEALGAYGIPAERKAIYRDIKLLQDFGLNIEKLRTSPVSYALTKRQFSQAELLLLVDAVQSSRFLTQRKSDALVRSLKTLGSKHQAKGLSKRLHVENRIKQQNESVFYNVDAVQRAIQAKRKISFLYFQYGLNKERELRHGGKPYEGTPVQLIYSDESYYLVLYSDKYDDFANYRVDRMLNIEITDKPASRNSHIATFDAVEYEARSFGMYTGSSVSATLLASEGAMNAIVDRFGKDASCIPRDDGKVAVHVQVMESPTLFGWLAQFGGEVVIEKPVPLKEAYLSHLRKAIEATESA